MIRWWAAGLAVAALLAGGVVAAVALSSGPTVSVAYVTGNGDAAQVWIRSLGGGPAQRLGSGSAPLLAPDGSRVAATAPAAASYGLALYPTAGGSPHRYFTAADATATAVAFSPDSRYAAVVLQSRDPASAAASGLAVIDTTTFAVRVVAHGQVYGASFDPAGSNRLAFASAPSPALAARVDISVIAPDGTSGATRITDDGRSLYPVWGRAGIAFDRQRLRLEAEPAYQVWVMASDGTGRRPLQTPAVPRLRSGLEPIAFSDDGRVLLADYVGPNTSEAWLLRMAGGSAAGRPEGRPIRLSGRPRGAAISRDGASVLVARGGFLNPSQQQTVESVPAGGGRARRLVKGGAEPSWNA